VKDKDFWRGCVFNDLPVTLRLCLFVAAAKGHAL
jgi:hypothetical protein